MSADVPSGPFQIGPFEALDRLGRGGFASVYRARDSRSGTFVALKVVPPGTDPESVRRLMREARAVARLSHPNVVRVYECGVTAEGAYVAMELLVGRTLQDLIDDVGALEVPRALFIAVQVLEGLNAAHENQVVHRDVKPGNIFLTRDASGNEVPHLLDFGVSKLGTLANAAATSQQDRTLPGTAMGTPGFMAPEQYGSAYAADARADVYGAAATLYTMLTGRLPFDAGTYESWVIKVKGERAPSISALAPHVAPDLALAIDRALARDPDARWSTAREFARALMGYAPPPFGSTTSRQRDQRDVFGDHASPLLSGVDITAVITSAAASTPRTERDPPSTDRELQPQGYPKQHASRAQPQPYPQSPPPASPLQGSSAAGVALTPSGSGSGSGSSRDRITAPPRPRSHRTNEPRNKRASGGMWFVSGALVGALLAALGAGLALWARSRTQVPAPLVSDAGIQSEHPSP